MRLSPKRTMPTSLSETLKSNSISLDLVLFYLMAQRGLWAKDKKEVIQAISDLRDTQSDRVIQELWVKISASITDEKIKEVNERTSEKWQNIRFSLLDELSSLEFQSSSISPSFLGEFIKNFVVSKFNYSIKTIFDPAFGLGNMIFCSLDGSKPGQSIGFDEDGKEFYSNDVISRRIEGTEIDNSVCLFANALGKLFGYDIAIKNGNSLDFRESLPSKHQLVVCQPPAGMKLHEEFLKQDWSFGQPSAQQADWAWAQIVYKHISADGYGLLFVPRGALFRTGPKELFIRSRMIAEGAIRAVINLPSGSSLASRVPMSLIILAGAEIPVSKKNEILFLSMPEPNEGRPGSLEYLSSQLKSIHEACDVFYAFEQGRFKRELGYSAVVGRTDKSLINNEWRIDPSNYVTDISTGINVKLDLNDDIAKISKESEELTNLIIETKKKFASFIIKAEFTTIGEMIKSGKLIQVTGMTKNELKKEPLEGALHEEYLTVGDIRDSGPLEASGKIASEKESSNRPKIRTEPNDVVFIKTGRPAAKVDYHGGALLYSPLSLLRLTNEGQKIFNHRILAFYLNGDGAKKFMHGGTIGRLEIEKVPFPIFDLATRDQINENLLGIEKLLSRSKKLSNKLDELELKLSRVLWGEFKGLKEAE